LAAAPCVALDDRAHVGLPVERRVGRGIELMLQAVDDVGARIAQIFAQVHDAVATAGSGEIAEHLRQVVHALRRIGGLALAVLALHIFVRNWLSAGADGVCPRLERFRATSWIWPIASGNSSDTPSGWQKRVNALTRLSSPRPTGFVHGSSRLSSTVKAENPATATARACFTAEPDVLRFGVAQIAGSVTPEFGTALRIEVIQPRGAIGARAAVMP